MDPNRIIPAGRKGFFAEDDLIVSQRTRAASSPAQTMCAFFGNEDLTCRLPNGKSLHD